MAESPETRILKDINRHLASIEEKDGLTDRLSPSETSALNKNVQEVLGNFTTLVSSHLNENIKIVNRALADAFGNLKGFNVDAQSDLLDEVVDELQMNNRFMAKSEQNDFLRESEREKDLNINQRTNELLEDILENDEDAASLSKSEAKETKSFLSGGLGGLFGGLFAGKSIKGLFGAIKGVGKKVFFPLLLAGAGVEFLRGWSEAGKDASVINKFNSAIGRMASDLTFGLVSKDFFTNALEGIQSAIGKVWSSFTDNWNKFITNKISSPDFFANLLSDLTMGALSPSQLKEIGSQIEDGMSDLVDTVVSAIVDGFISPTFDAISEKLVEILDDPVGFAKRKFEEFRAAQKDEAKGIVARSKELMKEKNLSEKAALRQAAIERSIEKRGIVGRVAGRGMFGLFKKFGLFSETQEEAAEKLAEEKAASDLKAKKSEERRLRLVNAKRERLAFREEQVEAEQKQLSNVGQEGLKQRIANERALTVKNQETGGGNAMQINNNTTVATPVDTRTENDDQINLRRSSGLFH